MFYMLMVLNLFSTHPSTKGKLYFFTNCCNWLPDKFLQTPFMINFIFPIGIYCLNLETSMKYPNNHKTSHVLAHIDVKSNKTWKIHYFQGFPFRSHELWNLKELHTDLGIAMNLIRGKAKVFAKRSVFPSKGSRRQFTY